MTIPAESNPNKPAGLRIAAFHSFFVAFELMEQWVAQAGHKIVLVVTTPGPKRRRQDGFKQIAASAGERNYEVLITTRLRTVATPLLQALQPDLIVSFSFPWLLPAELRQTAQLGAVNLHPALLPAHRGPNVLPQFYNADPMIGATLHWSDDNFDTGNILSQVAAPLPRPCTTETLVEAWFPTMLGVLSEGIPRAIAGDPGTPQPEEGASYGAEFSENDHWLSLDQPAFALQCKVTTLNLEGQPAAKTQIAGQDWLIEAVELLEGAPAIHAPGTLIERSETGMIVAVADGAVKLTATPLPASAE